MALNPVEKATVLDQSSVLELALRQFEAAADHLQLETRYRRILRRSRRELTVTFPVRMRDDSFAVFTGYRVHHNIVRGPAAGGIRYHPDLTIDAVRALALWSTWRSALLRIPFGGAYGGVVCDPTTMTEAERENLTRRFTTEISILLGPDRDIASPDRSTDAHVMGWMMDTYSMHRGFSVPAVVMGKPVASGGSPGWAASSGLGTAMLCRELARLRGLSVENTRVALQGTGPIGSSAARVLHEWGARIVAIGDGQQGVFQNSGLAVPAVLRYFDEHGSLAGCPEGSPVGGPTLAPLPCDILVLSGFERIDEQSARAMQAAVVVEGAYGTIAPEIDALLEARGIVVLPDILGGSGGAAASYFEWVQDIQETFWSEDLINSRIEEMLLRAFADTYTLHQRDGISLRLAAHCLAVGRVAAAHRIRGLYP